MIDYLEAELTGAPKDTSNTDNMALAEEANFDETITTESKDINDMENNLKEEQNYQIL